jgi:RNA polymerase sigma-70 factor, ECF subfamily
LNWLRSKINRERHPRDHEPSEAWIVDQLRRRDRGAFLSLYDDYGPNVYRYLLYMTASQELAEDLTQQVFLLILDDVADPLPLKHYDAARGNLEGYLLGIARNLVRSENRRVWRHSSLDSGSHDLNDWVSRLTDSGSNPLAELAHNDELERLKTLVQDLPEHYRSVIVLCDLQEKSYREVAKILECSEGTIASRRNRARAILTAKFHAQCRKPRQEDQDAKKGGLYERAYFLKD